MTTKTISTEKKFNRMCYWIQHQQKVDVFVTKDCHWNETIILGDWHDLFNKYPKLERWAEASFKEDKKINTVRFEFWDEWILCEDCARGIHTSGLFSETMGIVNDDMILCKDCFLKDIESLLDIFINDHKRVLPSWAKEAVTKLGFKNANKDSFRNGLHVGDNDDPIKLHKEYCAKCPEVLLLLDTDMFTASFDFYVRDNNEDKE